MKVCRGRKNMYSVMNHSGIWGELVYQKGGFTFIIPQMYINKDGSIKRSLVKKLQAVSNLSDIIELGLSDLLEIQG